MDLYLSLGRKYKYVSGAYINDAPHELHMPARLRTCGAHSFIVLVTELSRAGFSCEAVSSARTGDPCWLTMPGLGGLEAEIIVNDGKQIIGRFTRMISQSVLDHILKRCGAALSKN
jgi:hypothetical protein